ncbi:MAG: FUSC family protein [Hyphomicrobiales bacterium]|nr:FUSC family protein [Hyphomicrobiales bacterium]
MSALVAVPLRRELSVEPVILVCDGTRVPSPAASDLAMDVVAQSAEFLRRPSLLGVAEALRGKLRSAGPALHHGLRLSAAVSLALIVAFWLQLDNAYWAGTSASIVLQPALGASLRKGRFRAIGTVIGGIAILMLAAAFPQDRVGFLVCLTLWAAVCGYLATVLSNFAGYGAALAGITAVIVFAGIAQDPENVFQVTVRRITEIGIGIFAAGLVQSLSDFGDAARRLREAMTQVGRGIASGLSETLRAGAETAELRTSRRALIGAAIALDPLIDEAIGEPSHLRHQSGRLQAAFQALFVALSGWRGIGNHLDLTQQTGAAGSLAVLRRPIAQLAERDWLADPTGIRALCRTESRNVLQSAAPTPSSQLLIECEARVLRSLAVVADALVVMSGAGGAPPVRITSRLRVPDHLPALVNGLRVALALVAAELIWIASPWPSGTFMIIFTAVTVLMATRQADAAYSHAVQIAVGCVIAGLLAWLLDLAVLPLVHGGPFALSVALTLVFLPFGALSAGSWHKVVFVSAVTNLMPIVAIENRQAYDEARIFETTLAIGAGAVLAALFFRLLPLCRRSGASSGCSRSHCGICVPSSAGPVASGRSRGSRSFPHVSARCPRRPASSRRRRCSRRFPWARPPSRCSRHGRSVRSQTCSIARSRASRGRGLRKHAAAWLALPRHRASRPSLRVRHASRPPAKPR